MGCSRRHRRVQGPRRFCDAGAGGELQFLRASQPQICKNPKESRWRWGCIDNPSWLTCRSDAITDGIIGAAIKVHRVLGPGLLHSAYLVCLTQELVVDGYQVEVEKPISLSYGDDTIDCAFRADLMVDEQVIVEVKCLERFASVHRAQLLTYLKLTNCRVGLLINFNVPVLKDGIRRVANDLRDEQGNLA